MLLQNRRADRSRKINRREDPIGRFRIIFLVGYLRGGSAECEDPRRKYTYEFIYSLDIGFSVMIFSNIYIYLLYCYKYWTISHICNMILFIFLSR